MRRVTWLLFVLLSVVSMAMGFYDLYKNVPYFKQAIVAIFSPAAAVFEWLEHHTQVGGDQVVLGQGDERRAEGGSLVVLCCTGV
jgi:hypothetical protein